MSEKPEPYETVQIPETTADFIEKQPFFRLYNDLDDFVMDAVRKQLEKLMAEGIMK
jgi:Arc/MetJ-type ribon-helix-helix transcriptional regulator